MRKTTIFLVAVAAIVGLAIAPAVFGWGGNHQFSDYYNPSSSPDYFNPSTTRSPDYFNPSNAPANNPFSDYFNPGAGQQNGQFGAYGYSPAYHDPNYSGFNRQW